GSGVDLAQVTRNYEQLGQESLEDAQWYRERLDRFMVDWKRWQMEDTFASPEDFFRQCLAKMGAQRLLGLNAIRSNPKVIGHSMTGTGDQANCGEGLFTTWRVLKPGTVDAVHDGWAPLRWCLFVEPVNVYRGKPVRLEAVLANEDALKPGPYPVRLQVVGPNARQAFDRVITVHIPDPHSQPEPAFALPVFSEDAIVDGPPGKYRFLVTFEKGAAAMGGEAEFYLADPAELPAVETEVVLWGDDPELAEWLGNHGIRNRPFSPDRAEGREVILASGKAPAPGGAEVWRELARRVARGSTVVFLSPGVFKKDGQSTYWLPLENKGAISALPSWLYHKDEWTKRHPIFAGLPCGGLMDYTFYREIISDIAWVGQEVPTEVVAGATNTSQDYSAGLTVAVFKFGAGRFILNTLLIRENLGDHPVAERLLRNLLNYGAQGTRLPLAELPSDFDSKLKAIGYQ
ncbi:MAG: glycoside hydrolase family 2, partial [Candidatus Omnitrophica bacterium]|nr:glycoside hydrolase family 2 [Candidatus Omnitrophota bacterium]